MENSISEQFIEDLKMIEIVNYSSKQLDDFLKKINLEKACINYEETDKVLLLKFKIQSVYETLKTKIEKGKSTSFLQKKFFYDATPKESKLILNFELFKDFIFLDIYKIYQTDINQEIKVMAEVHSGGISVRNLLGINLTALEIKNILIKIINEFEIHILKNDKLDKGNYELKTAIKKEYKDFVNEILKENVDVEKKKFEIVVFSKMIYMGFLEMDLKTSKVKFGIEDYELSISFYIHIAFNHYYSVFKNTNKFATKDHFIIHGYNEWKDIIFNLSAKFNKMNADLKCTSVIIFVLDFNYYKLALNKKNKKISSLFPLNKEEVSKIDNEILIITL